MKPIIDLNVIIATDSVRIGNLVGVIDDDLNWVHTEVTSSLLYNNIIMRPVFIGVDYLVSSGYSYENNENSIRYTIQDGIYLFDLGKDGYVLPLRNFVLDLKYIHQLQNIIYLINSTL